MISLSQFEGLFVNKKGQKFKMTTREPVYWNQLVIPLEHLHIHPQCTQYLQHMRSCLPNVLFYGDFCNGVLQIIRSFAQTLLEEKKVFKIVKIKHNIGKTLNKFSANKKKSKDNLQCLTTRQSSQHIEFDMKHITMSRESLGIVNCVDDLLTMLRNRVYISSHPIIVVFLHIDALKAQEQQKLRVVIEKYDAHFRFFAHCQQKSKLIPPIRSRFTHQRIPKPQKSNMLQLANFLTSGRLNTDQLNRVYTQSGKHVNKFISGLQLMFHDEFQLQVNFDRKVNHEIGKNFRRLKSYIVEELLPVPNFQDQKSAIVKLSPYLQKLEGLRKHIQFILPQNKSDKNRFNYLSAQQLVQLLHGHLPQQSNLILTIRTLERLESTHYPVLVIEQFIFEMILT